MSEINNNNLYGLSEIEAAQLLNEYGENVITTKRKTGMLLAYLGQFRSPLVIILLISAVASFFLGQTTSAIIILAMVFLSTVLDFANSYRSEKAAADLEKSVRIKVSVKRDNKIKNIPINHVVPGDIINLEAGSIIPADGVIIEALDLSVDESSLTGESYPVRKNADQKVFMGASVISGKGMMRVNATGKATEFAKIAHALNKNTTSEFDLEIERFSSLIARITLTLVIIILAINLLMQKSAVDSLLFALALAVGLTPEMLPLIITINLSKGSIRMSKKGAIVKRLSAIQNFGAMDILCTDKTGTLTENKIQIATTIDYNQTESRRVLDLAAVICRFSTSYESPLDAAILKYRKYDFSDYKKISEIPFDFNRKRESVIVQTDHKKLLISKGAGDSMISAVSHYRDNGGRSHVLNQTGYRQLRQIYRHQSQQGYRLIAVATREIKDKDINQPAEENMVFEGFIAFMDPPKASAKKSLMNLAHNNIAIKIITGDDPLVTAKVARELELDTQHVVTGDQLEHWTDQQLLEAVDKTTIFARVNPSQKLYIIEALRARGHVVGYMGDGINDAPSLKAADIGVSVNNAVDVAKDAADVILLGKSLTYLTDGVIEGRKTFANTMKYLKMSLSSNFGNVFSMAGSSLFLPFLPMTAPQILLNNLLYDTSQFAIPSDNVDDEQLVRPRRMNIKSIRRFMWVFGGLSSLFDFLTFGVLLLIFHANAALFQTSWFIESLATQILVVFIFRTKRFALASRPGKILVGSILSILFLACLIALSPIGTSFGFVAPNILELGAITIIVITYLSIAEIIKLKIQHHFADM